ncbi:uncharacterized protein EAF02_009088 [Botrytis sinoallii]|uniref:uncharacterized protein n=1 Tax=Botrytis sinoallii TaxID=1463999 RepID=UPI0019012146|nr:uncharacterized protein EAF02_009088 [Botrytis sinoallii]KAF7871983.1 hypothetical protein EAF02_009088 [Botrytis sinoallii]
MARSFILIHIVSQTSVNAAVDKSTDDEIKAGIKIEIRYSIIRLAISIFQAENRKSEADTRSTPTPTSICETGIGYHWHPYARKGTVGGEDYGVGREGAGVGDAEGKGCEDAFVDEGEDVEVWGVVEMG